MGSLPLKWTALGGALALVAIAAGILLITGGDEPTPREGRVVGHVVDVASAGGRCSDERTAAEARSARTPWCSLRRAAAAAPPGAKVLVRRGRYERVRLEGKRSKVLRFTPYPGERVELEGVDSGVGRLRLEGFRITGQVNVESRATDVEIVRNRLSVAGREGASNIGIQAGAKRVLVADNRISQRASQGAPNAINFNSTDALRPIEDVTIRDNRIGPVTSGGDAIQAKNTRRLLVEDNEILDVKRAPGSAAHPDAFQSIYGSDRLTLRHNFIHDIAAQGIFVQEFRGENRRLVVEDNVVARVAYPWVPFGFNALGAKLTHNTIEGLMRGSGTSVEIEGNIAGALYAPPESTEVVDERYNLWGSFAGSPGRGSMVGRPAYRDAEANDFRLAPGSTGSGQAAGGADIGARRADFSASG